MTLAEVAVVVSIVATGLFTGLMITFQVVIQRVLRPLGGPEYTRTMQAVTRATDQPPTAPTIVLLGVLAPIFTLVRLRADAGSAAFRLTLIGWLVFTVGALVVTVALSAPINRRVLGWSPEVPPAEWAGYRDRWNGLNLIRTPASAVAFVLHILALRELAGEG